MRLLKALVLNRQLRPDTAEWAHLLQGSSTSLIIWLGLRVAQKVKILGPAIV